MNGSNIIEVENLIKKYKNSKVNAVDNVSFNVKEGEFFAFLGPNGAGKTTTISVLTTTLAKTSGLAKIYGYDVDKQAAEVRARIGVIFQKPSLDLNLTAEENIRLHAVIYKMYDFKPKYSQMPQDYKNKILELAEVLGLKDEIFKPIKTFSGGMKRKIEIVRTLIHKPKVLFLDEPTSGLDPLSRRNLWEYLKTIRKQENTTIFLTTHYLEEAEDADRVCIINHGKVIVDDTVESIKRSLIKDYIYVQSADLPLLQEELAKLNLSYEQANTGYKIFFHEGETQNIIKAINTKLSKLAIYEPTLEDVYLDLVKEDES